MIQHLDHLDHPHSLGIDGKIDDSAILDREASFRKLLDDRARNGIGIKRVDDHRLESSLFEIIDRLVITQSHNLWHFDRLIVTSIAVKPIGETIQNDRHKSNHYHNIDTYYFQKILHIVQYFGQR